VRRGRRSRACPLPCLASYQPPTSYSRSPQLGRHASRATCMQTFPNPRLRPRSPAPGANLEFTWIVDERPRPGTNLTSMAGIQNALVLARSQQSQIGTLNVWNRSRCGPSVVPLQLVLNWQPHPQPQPACRAAAAPRGPAPGA
jgi:hypothetical protein